MIVLTDCPAICPITRLQGREPQPYSFGTDWLSEGLWREFAGERQPWFVKQDEGVPDTWGIVIERSRISQFDLVADLPRKGTLLPRCLACVALTGENFHGQSKRPWQASRGNLHLSVFLRAGFPAADSQVKLSTLATLALLDILKLHGNSRERTGIRWLNDLFVQGRKVAGTITATQVQEDLVEGIVLGIGVNVEIAPAVTPTVFVRDTGCLRNLLPEAEWNVGRLFYALIKALQSRFERMQHTPSDAWIHEFTEASCCLGCQVRVWHESTTSATTTLPIAKGKLLSILPDLSLVVEGNAAPIAKGRLAFEEDCLALGL